MVVDAIPSNLLPGVAESTSRAGYPPWLRAVNEDGTRWVVTGGEGVKKDEAIINFAIQLPDGSKLSDSASSDLYEMVRAYAWVLRLYFPELSAVVHARRVDALLTFFTWLNLKRVRSLDAVSNDHIDLYVERVAFGKEWAVEAPHRLNKYLAKAIANEEELPRVHRYVSRLKKAAIYRAAGVLWTEDSLPSGLPICSSILQWLEKNLPPEEGVPTLESLLDHLKIKPNIQTKQNIHRALLPLEELWIWQQHLPQSNFSGRPFRRGASKIASSKGIDPNRHLTIPPGLAFEYLSDAVKWVVDFAPIVLDYVGGEPDLDELSARLKTAGLHIDVLSRGNSSLGKRQLNMHGLVKSLAASCFVVIATLTARRKDEIEDLGSRCVTSDAEGHAWMCIYIEKTTQRYDQIPVPYVVERAVDVMERVSERARNKSSADGLWQWQNLDDDSTKSVLPSSRDLTNLAVLNGSLEDSKRQWHFSAHQFRRFFAILYFWRYEKADLAALAHHLRHFDLEMTRRYVTDPEFGKVWKEAEEEWQGAFLRSVVYGSRSVGGTAGNRLTKESKELIAHFRRSVDVAAPERALKKLQRLAKRWGSEFKQHVWGTICACPQDTKLSELAKCKGASTRGPIFTNATEELCGRCPFAIQTDQFQEAVEIDLQARRDTAASCGRGTLLAEHSLIRVASLQSVINQGLAPPLPVETSRE